MPYKLYLGYEAGSEGTYQLSGAGELTTYEEHIGYNGKGTFIQSGGTNTVTPFGFWLGGLAGSEGVYQLSAGELSARDVSVGGKGTGTFIQSGTGELSTEYLSVGGKGTGKFIQTGGTNTVTGNLWLGLGSGSEGIYELGAGELTAGAEFVGVQGTGVFIQTGGTNVVEHVLCLGGSYGSQNVYQLSGGTLRTPKIRREHLPVTFDWTGGTLHVREFGEADRQINLINRGGILAPGTSIGSTSVYGDYVQTVAGTLAVELDSTGADHLGVYCGNLTLDGTLTVDALGGLATVGDHRLSIISAGPCSGQFATVPGLGEHLGYGVFFGNSLGQGVEYLYTPTRVAIHVCQVPAGDVDGDMEVGEDDFAAVLDHFGTSAADWTEGDVDCNGTVGNDDFAVVLGNFGATGAGNIEPIGTAELIYDTANGHVTLDPRLAASAYLSNFVLVAEGGMFPPAQFPEEAAAMLRFSTSTARPAEVSWSDLAGSESDSTWVKAFGESGLMELGNVFPAGMDLAQLDSYLTKAVFAAQPGTGTSAFHLTVVPEPGTFALLLIAAVLISLFRCRCHSRSARATSRTR